VGTLGYNYNLSKRTKVFAFVTKVDNEINGNYGFLTNLAGVDNQSVAAGIRHNF
jgi:predicted porin